MGVAIVSLMMTTLCSHFIPVLLPLSHVRSSTLAFLLSTKSMIKNKFFIVRFRTLIMSQKEMVLLIETSEK